MRQRVSRSDLTGIKFNRLTVVSLYKTGKNSSWLCKCDCGNELVVSRPNLRSGHTKSCGCYSKEFPSAYKDGRFYKEDYRKKYGLEYRLNNPEKIKQIARNWRSKNRHYAIYRNAFNRALKLQATPKWADKELIQDMYMEAKYQQMEVDHIVPLKGRTVCGLHWEGNLQLLTKSENCKKGNSHSEEYAKDFEGGV